MASKDQLVSESIAMLRIGGSGFLISFEELDGSIQGRVTIFLITKLAELYGLFDTMRPTFNSDPKFHKPLVAEMMLTVTLVRPIINAQVVAQVNTTVPFSKPLFAETKNYSERIRM